MPSVLRIFVFVFLLVVLFFAIIYVFAGLPYFLQPIAHICIFLLLCRFLPVSLPRFGQLLVHAFRFLLLFKMVHDRYFVFCLFFCLVTALLDAFCGSFFACFFCCVNQRVISIFTCSFSFFSGGVVCFFALKIIGLRVTQFFDCSFSFFFGAVIYFFTFYSRICIYERG